MKSSHFRKESDHQDPFDRHLVDRLRRIAETQRAPARLREHLFAELAREQFEGRRSFRWDLLAASLGGALVSAAAAAVIWFAAPPSAVQSSPELSSTAWLDVAMNKVTGSASMETDQPASLRSWFESQVNHTVDVPAIPDAELLGGRLAFVGGIRGAAVEYRMHDVPLTYLMVPESYVMDMFADALDTLVTGSSQGYRIVMWKQGGATRALVAPMPLEELSQIAEHCRRTMM